MNVLDIAQYTHTLGAQAKAASILMAKAPTATKNQALRALARLLRQAAQAWPILEAVGHEHVAPGRKHDPGAGFDWRRLARHLGAHKPLLPLLSRGT